MACQEKVRDNGNAVEKRSRDEGKSSAEEGRHIRLFLKLTIAFW